MDQEQVRRLALALPEAVEAPHHDRVSFRVAGKIFATLPPDGGEVNVLVDPDEVAAAVAADPTAYAPLWWGKKLSGVRVTLAAADPVHVEELLADAWRRKAPRALVSDHETERP